MEDPSKYGAVATRRRSHAGIETSKNDGEIQPSRKKRTYTRRMARPNIEGGSSYVCSSSQMALDAPDQFNMDHTEDVDRFEIPYDNLSMDAPINFDALDKMTFVPGSPGETMFYKEDSWFQYVYRDVAFLDVILESIFSPLYLGENKAFTNMSAEHE
jgi:hypothetical protein